MTASARHAKSSGPVAVTVVERADPVVGAAARPPEPAAGPAALPRAAAHIALARLRVAAAQLLPQVRYRIVRLGSVGQTGLAALAAAAAIAVGALLPAQRALQTVSAELTRVAHAPVAASAAPAAPRVLALLPTRAEVPAVIGQVFAEAKTAGVSLDSGHYLYSATKGRSIARYELEFPVKASYPNIRSFIDRTLSAVPAAALGKLRFERKAVGDALVGADIVFVVFVRGAEQT